MILLLVRKIFYNFITKTKPTMRLRQNKINSKFKKSVNSESTHLEFTNNAVGNRSIGLEVDLRLREFEINQLTQRNNFFMIFQGVLIGSLVQSQGSSAPIINFSMSLLGCMVSVFQIGMAGGAKYWQSRWEAATRSSEIEIILELTKRNKSSVQTFTTDLSPLNDMEIAKIVAHNNSVKKLEDKIINDPDYIKKIVEKDIERVSENCLSRLIDKLVNEIVILPKWSVSRIPIWIGIFLFIFWLIIFLNSFKINQLSMEPIYNFLDDYIEIVNLK